MTGQCSACGGWHTSPLACPAQLSNAGASYPLHDLSEHYKALFERASHERDWHKALLFDAWRTMAGQTRGLQRQRRLIKRLQAELAKLTTDQQSPAP